MGELYRGEGIGARMSAGERGCAPWPCGKGLRRGAESAASDTDGDRHQMRVPSD